MIDLKKYITIADQVSLVYEGPGYYSGKTNRPLSDSLVLAKVAEDYIDEEDIEYFCKTNGYKIVPYLINSPDEVPSSWEIVNPGKLFEDEYLNE